MSVLPTSGQVQQEDVHRDVGRVDHVRRQGLRQRDLRQLVVGKVRLGADRSSAIALSVLRELLVLLEVLAEQVVVRREVVVDLYLIVALIGLHRLVVDVIVRAASGA